MAEYIDRETVIKSLEKLCDRVCQYSKAQRKVMCSSCPLGDAFTVIEDDIPQADVRPVVRGKWITTDDDDNRIAGRCSACGWEAHLYEDDVVGMNYCPNCGSGMGEE